MNVLEELDCIVTQRRIHTMQHRNIRFPPWRGLKSDTKCETARPPSENFLADDAWWHNFVYDDLEMDEDFLLGPLWPAKNTEPPQTQVESGRKDSTEPFRSRDVEWKDIFDALPPCSHCRDRRIKCFQELPACRNCITNSRECVIYDPILKENVALRYVLRGKALQSDAPGSRNNR